MGWLALWNLNPNPIGSYSAPFNSIPTKESVQETVSNYSLDYGCPGGTSLPKKNQLVSSWLITIIISRSNMDGCLHLDPAHPLPTPTTIKSCRMQVWVFTLGPSPSPGFIRITLCALKSLPSSEARVSR